MRKLNWIVVGVLAVNTTGAGERKAVPATVAPTAAYSPGLMTDEYLYVSGQLGRDAAGSVPKAIEDQAKIVLDSLKSTVEAAGLTMDHVVYTNLFLTDMRNYEAVNKIYATYFPNMKPARATIGVARLPFSCGMEISAIAVRDLASKKAVNRPQPQTAIPITEGIKTGDRFFLSGTLGRDAVSGAVPKLPFEQVKISLERVKGILKLAGLTEAAFVSVNVYHTAAISRDDIDKAWAKEFGAHVKAPVTYIKVNELALSAKFGFTGVAALNTKHLKFKNGCGELGGTVYCSVEESGMGPIEQQTRDTLTRLGRNLAGFGLGLADISAIQLYLDSMDDFAKMNTSYIDAMPPPRPARATIQPVPSGDSHRLIQATLIASPGAEGASSSKRKAK